MATNFSHEELVQLLGTVPLSTNDPKQQELFIMLTDILKRMDDQARRTQTLLQENAALRTHLERTIKTKDDDLKNHKLLSNKIISIKSPREEPKSPAKRTSSLKNVSCSTSSSPVKKRVSFEIPVTYKQYERCVNY
jgi:hypothetical protein